jgi:ABC-type branched-subunit amino acid transport system substrate-binding protein
MRCLTTVRLGIACVGAAATLGVVGCGGESASDDRGGTPLKLGAILPQTGDLASFGPPTVNAAELAVKEASDAGGVNGSDVTLTIKDEGGSPETTRASAEALRSDGVQAVVGAFGSASSLTVIDALTQSEIVMISPANGGEEFTDYPDGGFYFRTVPASSNEGNFGADEARERGIESIAIFAQKDSYGQAYADAFQQRFEAKGGTVTERVDFDAKSTSFDGEVRRVVESDPDAVALVAYADTGALIARTAYEQGLLERPWIITDGIKDPKFPASVFPDNQERFDSWVGTGAGEPDGESYARYAEAYEREYGEAPGAFGSNTYDAAWLAILAAEAGNGSGRSISEELVEVSGAPGDECIGADCLELVRAGKDIDYVGASGEIDFDAAGNVTTAHYVTWRFDGKGGTENIELVERDLGS